MQVTKIRNGKRYETTNGPVVEARLVRKDGSTKHYALYVDDQRVGYLSRPGSSPLFRTTMIYAPEGVKNGTHIGGMASPTLSVFDQAAYSVAMAAFSWAPKADEGNEQAVAQ